MNVYILHHEYDLAGEDETKLIGTYASEQAAMEAAERSRLLPGFREHPDDFVVSGYELGRDHWTRGFDTDPPVARTADQAA